MTRIVLVLCTDVLHVLLRCCHLVGFCVQDEAARRRLVKRLYIPLPDVSARRALLSHLLSAENHALQQQDVEVIVTRSEGYSGADVRALCTEAAFGPIRR